MHLPVRLPWLYLQLLQIINHQVFSKSVKPLFYGFEGASAGGGRHVTNHKVCFNAHKAKWWPGCLRSVSVCEKVIKIKICCCCREEAWATCTRRGSSTGEKTGRFWLSARWGPVRSGLKEYRIHLKEGEKDYLQSSHLSKSLSNPSTSHLSSHVQQHILTLIGLITMLACVLYCLVKAYLIQCSRSAPGSVHQFEDSAAKID